LVGIFFFEQFFFPLVSEEGAVGSADYCSLLIKAPHATHHVRAAGSMIDQIRSSIFLFSFTSGLHAPS